MSFAREKGVHTSAKLRLSLAMFMAALCLAFSKTGRELSRRWKREQKGVNKTSCQHYRGNNCIPVTTNVLL